MSSDMTIGGAAKRQAGIERIQEAAIKSTPSRQEAAISSIHSVQDMEMAELKGTAIPVSDEQLIRAIDRAIKAMQGTATSLEFSVHEKTKQIMVKVTDKETGEVIREIPPEKTLDLVAKMWEMAGILIDERR